MHDHVLTFIRLLNEENVEYVVVRGYEYRFKDPVDLENLPLLEE